MIFGPSGRGHDSNNQLDLTLDPPTYSTQSKKKYRLFRGNFIFGRVKVLEIENCESSEKTRAETSLRSVLEILEDLEGGIKIFKKT